MSSNNRPWKEVNLIRRYEEKNSNRLKESRGLNILSIELKDNIESLLNTGVLKLNKDIKEKKNKKEHLGDKIMGSKSWKDDNLIKKIRESFSESTIVLRVDALGKARALKVAERINSILERNSLVDGEYTVNDMDGESGIYEVFFSSPIGDLDTLVDEVSSVLRDTPVSKFLVGNLHEASNDMDAVDFEI